MNPAVKKCFLLEIICAVNILTLNSTTIVTWYKSEYGKKLNAPR